MSVHPGAIEDGICAVFGPGLLVGPYSVQITKREPDGNGFVVLERKVNLGPRGLERLAYKIEQGVTPPTQRAKADG